MNLSRRDFIKVFGVSIASLILTRCKTLPQPTPTPIPTPRDILRTCWTGFSELASTTRALEDNYDQYMENALGSQMIADHRRALDELMAAGELTSPVADLVQEGFAAAVYHVWRSNVPITCYEPVMIDYAPVSANILVQQAAALSEFARAGEIDPGTLAIAQAALEHDLAFIAMDETDINALYEQILADCNNQYECIPRFDAVPLEPSADAQTAARFIVDLLTGA